MRRWTGVAVFAGSAVATTDSQASGSPAVAMPQARAFRVLFGLTDRQLADWRGKISVAGGKVVRVQGWRFQQNDTADSVTGWRASTRRCGPQELRTEWNQ